MFAYMPDRLVVRMGHIKPKRTTQAQSNHSRPSKLFKSERATIVRMGHSVPNGYPRIYRTDPTSERVVRDPDGRIKERCPQGVPTPKAKARHKSSPSFPRCQEQYYQTVLQVIIKGDTSPRDEGTHPRLKDSAAAADEDDDDLDLFADETEEEKKAAEARDQAKASTKKKESGKSSVLMDVKPWDDETDMKKLEEAVRSVDLPGLLWGASKLVPVGYGIKKLTIMLTIVDDLVSVDSLIEERLQVEPINEYVQSCDIVAFNKI
ncbi:elongation factor 1-beta 2-like protein [Tanacetum coccineum]